MDKKILEHINAGARSLGPAQYCIKTTIGKGATDPTIEKNPAYSMLGKRKNDTRTNGPWTWYYTFGLTEHGKHEPTGGVMGVRPRAREAKVTPGPADYCVKPIRTNVGYKMRQPYSGCQDRWQSPAPNAYQLPDTLKGPRPTIASRWAEPCVKFVMPGPGHYDSPHPDWYLPGATRSGRTMAGRPKDTKKDACAPGPSDYDGVARVNCCARPRGVKEDCLRQPCRTTFGVRRPDTVGVFAVPRDNEYDC